VDERKQAVVNRWTGWGSLVRLVRVVPVLVLDISENGCLLESRQPFEQGRVGTLRVAMDGGWQLEDLRVTRCLALPGGGSTYRVGAEFLRTPRSPAGSLRHAIGRLTGGSSEQGLGGGVQDLLEEER
jgi:hypothetical protein